MLKQDKQRHRQLLCWPRDEREIMQSIKIINNWSALIFALIEILLVFRIIKISFDAILEGEKFPKRRVINCMKATVLAAIIYGGIFIQLAKYY